MRAGAGCCVFDVEEGDAGAGDDGQPGGEAGVDFEDVQRGFGGVVAGQLGRGSACLRCRNILSDSGHLTVWADPDHVEREPHLLHPERLDTCLGHEEQHAGVLRDPVAIREALAAAAGVCGDFDSEGRVSNDDRADRQPGRGIDLGF